MKTANKSINLQAHLLHIMFKCITVCSNKQREMPLERQHFGNGHEEAGCSLISAKVSE